VAKKRVGRYTRRDMQRCCHCYPQMVFSQEDVFGFRQSRRTTAGTFEADLPVDWYNAVTKNIRYGFSYK
jgi:hypothetical protein